MTTSHMYIYARASATLAAEAAASVRDGRRVLFARLARLEAQAERRTQRLLYLGTPVPIGAPDYAEKPEVTSFLMRMGMGIDRPDTDYAAAHDNELLLDERLLESVYDTCEPLKALWRRAYPPPDGNIRPAVRTALATLWGAELGGHPRMALLVRKERDSDDFDDTVASFADLGTTTSHPPPPTDGALAAVDSILHYLDQGLLARPRIAPADALRLLRSVEDSVMVDAAAASKEARNRRRAAKQTAAALAISGPLSGTKRKPETSVGGSLKKAKLT